EHLVLDRHALADKRMALNLAAGADPRAALDLDERPDPTVVADRAAVQIGERANVDAFAELDVVEQPVRGLVCRRTAHAPRSKYAWTPWTTADSSASVMPGKIGSDKPSRTSASATGNEPTPSPRCRYARDRWIASG